MTKIPELANWLARDKDGKLWAYSRKPLKGIQSFVANGGCCEDVEETDETFKTIRWTDQEPTKIKRGLEAGGVNDMTFEQIAQANGTIKVTADTDIINEPNHYKGKHGIETIDVIRNFGNDDMVAGFYWGNAIKYMTRYRNKNGLEDLKKARRNLDWLIEHTEKV